MKKDIATFAMGCFWQPDYTFAKVKGIIARRVGYTGCNKECRNPTYEQVCSEKTGCAEAVELTFNPEIVSYDELLDIFWTHHDPTQLNQQGPDVGTQYRSAIFYHSEQQRIQAQASQKKWTSRLIDPSKKIATEIIKATPFYVAENYHQNYLQTTGRVCHLPKRVFA